MTAGQLAGAGVIALAGPLGYPAFALLYAGSAGLRVIAFRQAGGVDMRPAERPLKEATAESGATAVA